MFKAIKEAVVGTVSATVGFATHQIVKPVIEEAIGLNNPVVKVVCTEVASTGMALGASFIAGCGVAEIFDEMEETLKSIPVPTKKVKVTEVDLGDLSDLDEKK